MIPALRAGDPQPSLLSDYLGELRLRGFEGELAQSHADRTVFATDRLESRASRRAISVFPMPVEPIIIMFFGMTSWARSAGRFWRRMRFRNAMATARFAACWPTTYLSSSSTI